MKYRRMLAAGLAAIGLVGSLIGASLLETHQADAALPPYTTTLTNFDPQARQVTRFDVEGNAVDAHDGDLVYFEDKYYLYGTSYDCGFVLEQTGTPFCGFKSYSSTDLVHWTDEGFLFDATTPAWQASCAPPRYGCFRPHVLHNDSTNKYVLWINSYDNASGYHVFTADSPKGPFVEQAEPDLALEGTPGTLVNGDMDIFKDDNGTAYIAYTNINTAPSHSLRIQQLNATYTSGTGPAVQTGTSSTEAPSLFRRGNTYYLVYGPNCPYCSGIPTQYKTATSPLGTWSAATQIQTNSCGGQPSFVSKIPGVSGDTYLFGSDLWAPGDNQALANYFWKPLAFSGTAISAVTCSNQVTFTLGEGAPGKMTFPAGADQSSGAQFFRTYCDIKSVWSRAQTFTPSRSATLKTASFTTFKSAAAPNDNLRLEIVLADDNGGQLGSPLYTVTVPAASIGRSPQKVTISPNISVHGGMRYGLTVSSLGSNNGGCYGMLYNDYKPYQHGKAVYLPTGGAWTPESARSLKFDTTLE